MTAPSPNLSYRDVSLRGVRVRVGEAGEGPPLLLVHGFLVSHREWRLLIPELEKDFRCIAPDLPGAGMSEKPSPEAYPYTREAFADALVDLLRELGVARTHVVAHSMGGGVALTLAADHPEVVARLTVIDPLCYPYPLPFKGRLPLVPGLGPLVFKMAYRRPIFMDYFKNDIFNGKGIHDPSVVSEYYDDFVSPGGRDAAYATLQRSVADKSSLVPKIARVAAPTCILWGSEDRAVPPNLAHRLVREIPNAHLHMLEGAGHSPGEEAPAWTAGHIREHHLGHEG